MNRVLLPFFLAVTVPQRLYAAPLSPLRGMDNWVIIAVLIVAGSALLFRSNLRLRRSLRQENHQRIAAETALAKQRSELRRHVSDRDHALHQLSFFDPLTDLPNRSFLYEQLIHASHTYHRQDKAFALMLIDLNGFKAINDTLGHYVGDAILQEVAVRLQKATATDTICYLGGDEFAIMQPLDSSSTNPLLIAENIHDALAKPFIAKGLPISVGAGIGIAYYPQHTTDADNLLRYAEIAMYSAKRAKQDHAIYDPAQSKETRGNLVLAGELRKALNDEELVVHYQPKLDLSTGRVVGVEALVRWQHPREGLMNPQRFIELAEQTGLIRPLTLWVLNHVLGQCADWRRNGIVLPVAVNLSVLNLHDVQLHLQIEELLDAWGLDGDAIEIEITETAAVDDPARVCGVLERLGKLGIRIAIDDFGTGYSALAYLKRLPVHMVKVDKSFVLGMDSDEDNAVIVHAMVELAHNLGLTVTAEGVESQETLEWLVQIGCDFVQGFHIGRPLPADELLLWLERLENSTVDSRFCSSFA